MFYIQKHFSNGVVLTLVDLDRQEGVNYPWGSDLPVWRQYNGPIHNIKNVMLFNTDEEVRLCGLDMMDLYLNGYNSKVHFVEV